MTPDQARQRASAPEAAHVFISLTEEQGTGPLVAVKDLVDVAGTVTTAGATVLPEEPAAEDAPLLRGLRARDGVCVGKANLHEFAYGLTSINPHYGTVPNPRYPGRVAGGSSGGSAAAVALGLCDWAIGTDTGGSIRVPAAFCGVVGLKPTIGRVDTEGVFPLSRTLDTVGPLGPDVASCAAALEILSGMEDLVPSSPPPLERFRLAVPEGWGEDLDQDTDRAWRRVAGDLPRIPFPDQQRLVDVGAIILRVEAAALHRRWLERHPERYGADIRGLLEVGLQVPRRDYVEALAAQARARTEVEQALAGWDGILLPTVRVVAPLVEGPHDRGLLSDYTRPFNTTGHPVVALPAPAPGPAVGIQVVGHFAGERDLLALAAALERDWAGRL
ncbi:MAG TPA: amidase [Candidatus Dormibacteraeota bacterium]|jgi:Asp-tRNA(Asn)/Glu-tRNA(Gln) amidotransferase A subunit family amidase|nr:amidase [Candidatus Dormibacteraeota bacterium]